MSAGDIMRLLRRTADPSGTVADTAEVLELNRETAMKRSAVIKKLLAEWSRHGA